MGCARMRAHPACGGCPSGLQRICTAAALLCERRNTLAVSPQTNTDLASIAAALQEGSHYAICGHVNPDGDCLGSMLALSGALRALGKRVDCLLVEDAPVEEGLHFLPGFETLTPAPNYAGHPDTFITVDVSLASRIGVCADIRSRCARTISIDHHRVPETYSQLNYVDPDAPAACLIVWNLIKLLPVRVTPDIALCAYTGLMTDTGRFQFQNTNAESYLAASEMVAAGVSPDLPAREVFQSRSMASLHLECRLLERMELLFDRRFSFSYLTRDDFREFGASKADAEPLIDTLRSVRGIEVACILKDQPDGAVRGSFRAKTDADVSAMARALGGGGHRAAAGFTFDGTLAEAIVAVKRQVGALYGQESR